MDFSKLIQQANANKSAIADAQKFVKQTDKLQSSVKETIGVDSQVAEAAVAAKAKLATDPKSSQATAETIATQANAATAEAGKQAAALAADKDAAAKKDVENSPDMWSTVMNKAKSADAGLSAAKSLSGMKIGSFALPAIQIPDIKLPELAADLKSLTEAFNNSELVKQIKANIADVQKKIEERRAEAEAERKKAEEEQKKADLEAQKAEEERLQAEQELLDGMYEIEEESMLFEDQQLNGDDANCDNSDMSEAMAEAAEAAANGEAMDPQTELAMIEQLETSMDPNLDDAIMRTAFTDQSGEMAEAIAQADQENGWDPRGNGPCGGGTRSLGGVNFNTPEQDQLWEDYMAGNGYDPIAYDYWYDDYDPYNDPIYSEDEEEESSDYFDEHDELDYPDQESIEQREVAQRLLGETVDSDIASMDSAAQIRQDMEDMERLGMLSEDDRKTMQEAIAEAEGQSQENAQEKASLFDSCIDSLKSGATNAGNAMVKGLNFLFNNDTDVLKGDMANAGDNAPQTKAGIWASLDLGNLSDTVSGITKHATNINKAVGKFMPDKTKRMMERVTGSLDATNKNVALAHETKKSLDKTYSELYDEYLAEKPEDKQDA